VLSDFLQRASYLPRSDSEAKKLSRSLPGSTTLVRWPRADLGQSPLVVGNVTKYKAEDTKLSFARR